MVTNHILAIGISEYEHWDKLNNPTNDIDQIVGILTEKYQFEDGNVTKLYNDDATLSALLYNLHSYVLNQTPSDNLIILFAGHGDYEKDIDVGYWIPYDARKDSKSTYLSISTIKDYLKSLKSHHLVIMSDSCFSGSIFRAPERGVNDRLYSIPSRWALTSGRLEKVSDGNKGSNSPFAKSIIKHLTENKNNELSISDLSQNVSIEVANLKSQVPRGEPLSISGHEGGQFFFKIKNSPTALDVPEQKIDSPEAKTVLLNKIIAYIKEEFKNYSVELKGNAKQNAEYLLSVIENNLKIISDKLIEYGEVVNENLESASFDKIFEQSIKIASLSKDTNKKDVLASLILHRLMVKDETTESLIVQNACEKIESLNFSQLCLLAYVLTYRTTKGELDLENRQKIYDIEEYVKILVNRFLPYYELEVKQVDINHLETIGCLQMQYRWETMLSPMIMPFYFMTENKLTSKFYGINLGNKVGLDWTTNKLNHAVFLPVGEMLAQHVRIIIQKLNSNSNKQN